jgi:ketosteroid isomerase-like protein
MNCENSVNHRIGQDVVDHVNSGIDSDAPLWDKHYHPDFESVEGDGTTHKGRAQVQEKHNWWNGMMTVHSVSAEGPFVGDSGFTVMFTMDVEAKDGSQPRSTMREIGVYTVKDGKVVREEFMYGG